MATIRSAVVNECSLHQLIWHFSKKYLQSHAVGQFRTEYFSCSNKQKRSKWKMLEIPEICDQEQSKLRGGHSWKDRSHKKIISNTVLQLEGGKIFFWLSSTTSASSFRRFKLAASKANFCTPELFSGVSDFWQGIFNLFFKIKCSNQKKKKKKEK